MRNNVFCKLFMWMFIGLLITFITGYVVSINENMLYNIFSGGLPIIFCIIELVLVVVLTRRIMKMETMTARFLFCLYSFVSGLTFSVIFVAYEMSSVIFVFLIAALVFLIFAIIGYTTKIDLSKFSTILFMALIGALIVSIINFFIGSAMIDFIISWVLLIVFMGITAYDMQKIKKLDMYIQDENKVAIIGALELYLDFINIFIELLRIFGKSRD